MDTILREILAVLMEIRADLADARPEPFVNALRSVEKGGENLLSFKEVVARSMAGAISADIYAGNGHKDDRVIISKPPDMIHHAVEVGPDAFRIRCDWIFPNQAEAEDFCHLMIVAQMDARKDRP